LTRFGTPKRIADAFDPENRKAFDVAFACSLCGFCSVVCPQGADPDGLFLAMRRAAVASGRRDAPAHRRLIRYEARGCSPRYSWYGFPEGCDTVFFPGCTLAGTRPGQTLAALRSLQQEIPFLGIVLDCCIKPSHDLGRTAFFDDVFGALRKHLLDSGIRRIVTACPSCHKVFKIHGSPLRVESMYEILAASKHLHATGLKKEITVHDPCPVRLETGQHKAVRHLAMRCGGKISEMPRSGRLTLCCGEGGAVGHLLPDLSKTWTVARRAQAAGRHIVTYCAGCSGFLSAVTPASHIIDFLFSGDTRRPFKMKVSRPPMTYLNRIRLKYYLKRRFPAAIAGTRPFR
jgi:Fe-S oxidoreductase